MEKIAVVLMVLTVTSKVSGFCRDLTLSYFYGASNISDAYLVSMIIPTVIFEHIGAGIYTSYIPTYNNVVKEKDEQAGLRFTNNVVNMLTIICTLIVIIVITFTVPIIKLFALGFEGETLSLAVCFTRISIFSIYFTGLAYIFGGYLNLKNQFVAPVIMGIPLNVITIISILLSTRFNIIILSIGSFIGMAIQMLFLLPFVCQKSYKYSFILDSHDDYLKKMIYLSVPIIISFSINQITVLINQTLASKISIGGIAALIYANRLNLIVQEIFVVPITTVVYPMICQRAADNNILTLKKTVAESINRINLLVIPAMVGCILFAEPIVKLLFGRGAFTTAAVAMTSNALFYFAIGMVGLGLREILTKTFYSLHDTKTPIINAALAMIINIILSYILSQFLGVGGLALANSISAILCTIFLIFSLKNRIGLFGGGRILFSLAKILIASSIMGMAAKLLYNNLITHCSLILTLFLSIGIAFLSYSVVIYFMKIDEAQAVIKELREICFYSYTGCKNVIQILKKCN